MWHRWPMTISAAGTAVLALTVLASAVLALAVLALAVLASACDKPSGSSRGGVEERASPRESGPQVAKAADAAADARPEPPPRPPRPVSPGPTGMVECDRALEVVCRCAKEQATLGQSCKTLTKDAPLWRARAKTQEPEQIEDLRKACQRILQSVEAAFGCK